jgi:Enoyl-(Acyl carrier protein) reductase
VVLASSRTFGPNRYLPCVDGPRPTIWAWVHRRLRREFSAMSAGCIDGIADEDRDVPFTGTAEGRVVIVTAAGSGPAGVGIGQAIALRFARENASVCLFDISAERSERTRAMMGSGERAFVAAGDVTSEQDCEWAVAETVARSARSMWLVNNVALPDGRVPVHEMTAAHWIGYSP